MDLVTNRSYYIGVKDTVLRKSPSGKSSGINHLIFGDWLKYLGETSAAWAKVKCRGDTGWIIKSSISEKRKLEINFVDIGQGDGCHIVTPDDQVILIDAGMGENMFRFLSWRYNLRGRKVAGVDGIAANATGTSKPFPINHVIISHPDKDHYYGFQDVFASRKLLIERIYHNGVIERPIKKGEKSADLQYPSGDDLGGYLKASNGKKYLWDVVTTNSEVHSLISKHKKTRKNFLNTLVKAKGNNDNVKFTSVSIDDKFIGDFDESSELTFKVLGPVTENVQRDGKSKKCLLKLGNEGVTKNGHSVVVQLQIGKLKVLLGGDLNTESQDYLMRHYTGADKDISKLEATIRKIKAKGDSLSQSEKQKRAEAEVDLAAIVTKGQRHFRSDVAKACHHGSHHFSESFIKVVDAIATVISSGDNESYAHPRPDALGAFGKYGRGERPLIFSTELARSTKEFTNIGEYFDQLRAYQEKIAATTSERTKARLKKEMNEKKDRNVAVYGMITLRTDGEKTIIAQKLEKPRSESSKWDIHELKFNKKTQDFEYARKGGH